MQSVERLLRIQLPCPKTGMALLDHGCCPAHSREATCTTAASVTRGGITLEQPVSAEGRPSMAGAAACARRSRTGAHLGCREDLRA